MAPSFLLQEAVLDPLYFLTYQHVCRAMVLAKIVAANFTVLYVVAILLLGTCDNFAPVAVYQGYTHSGSYILYCNLYRILALVIPRPSGATRPQPSSVYHPYTPQRRGITNIYAGWAFKCSCARMAPSSRNHTFVVIGLSTLTNLTNDSSVHRN